LYIAIVLAMPVPIAVATNVVPEYDVWSKQNGLPGFTMSAVRETSRAKQLTPQSEPVDVKAVLET
jgi:hypothetical protein